MPYIFSSIPKGTRNIKWLLCTHISFLKKSKKVLDKLYAPCYNLRVRFETPV